MNTGGAFVTFVTVTPMTNTTSSLYSPNQNTGRGDASTTSAVTLQQLAEEVTLHPTSNSLATCPGAVQLSQPTIWHLRLQTPRASSDDTGGPPLEFVEVFMDNSILLTPPPPLHNNNKSDKSFWNA